MGIRLRKNAVDLGIVAKDGPTMLSFYETCWVLVMRETYLFPWEVLCTDFGAGTAWIKIVVPEPSPKKFPENRG